MPAPKVSILDVENAIAKYNLDERPWRQTLNRVDWFIAFEGDLYPLKYTYALAANIPPSTYSTNQIKSALKELKLSFHSLKAESEIYEEFESLVRKSRLDPSGRAKRLKNARKRPVEKFVVNLSYVRNHDVVAEVLERAKGICESCNKGAPFLRAKDNTPYLEIHHKVFLASGGDDSVENAEALCPNCHRQKHYGLGFA